MDNDQQYRLTELDDQSPEKIAGLLIDLSELIDGVRDHPRQTPSYSLLNRLSGGEGEEYEQLMQDPLQLLPLYFSIVQYVLVEHVETPAVLEEILRIMEEHHTPGGRANEYLQVIKETFARTIEASKAVYARMEALSAELEKFERNTGEQAEALQDKMVSLSAELEQEQQEVFAKTEAMIARLEELSSGRSTPPKESPKVKQNLITVGSNIEVMLVVALVVLFVIILVALLSI